MLTSNGALLPPFTSHPLIAQQLQAKRTFCIRVPMGPMFTNFVTNYVNFSDTSVKHILSRNFDTTFIWIQWAWEDDSMYTILWSAGDETLADPEYLSVDTIEAANIIRTNPIL